jgi:rhodanese-related sulfurtransferase/DNA-binding transcriptional ArsR family regulator
MSRIDPRSAVFAGLAGVGRALGHRHRLEILELVAQGERGVEALASHAGLSVANASRHLQVLRDAGLVTSRRDGQRILYQLSHPMVLDLIAALYRVAEFSVAAVREAIGGYFRDRDAMEPVTRDWVAQRLDAKLVTVLDVRPKDEFDTGHLPQAVNIPLDDLSQRLAEIPKTLEIIIYCRGRYSVRLFEAVALLRQHGFQIRRLEEGYPEWQAAGLPVEIGTIW